MPDRSQARFEMPEKRLRVVEQEWIHVPSLAASLRAICFLYSVLYLVLDDSDQATLVVDHGQGSRS
jgi:hypothetical protein